jgi:hypothetical protein
MRAPEPVDFENGEEEIVAGGNEIEDLRPMTRPFQPKGCVVLRFHTFVGCIPNSNNKIGHLFKSLGYERVDVEFEALH